MGHRRKTKKIWNYAIFWIIIFLIVACGIFWLPYLMTTRSWFNIDFSETGNVGDTIGGITSPFIACIASLLTFVAFWVQYKANNEQRADINIERFENKFYELLRLHKQNVDEFYIGVAPDHVENRKAFVSLYNEFRYTFFCCQHQYEELKRNRTITENYSDEQLIRLAYIFFYAGVGENSNIVSRAMNIENFNKILFDVILLSLTNAKHDYRRGDMSAQPKYIDSYRNQVNLTVKYIPWGGHQSRLGHYYRHLFQTVKFVVKQSDDIINKEEKLEYLRTLRAQLSDHEQLMLYYNAIAEFGKAWIKDEKNDNINYFTEYKMIHNIPIPLANFGIKPQDKFAHELEKDPTIFEWLE